MRIVVRGNGNSASQPSKFSSLYEFELQSAQIGLQHFDSHGQLASATNQIENVLYFEYANDNIHLPIILLGLIINGLYFSHDNIFSIECIICSETSTTSSNMHLSTGVGKICPRVAAVDRGLFFLLHLK